MAPEQTSGLEASGTAATREGRQAGEGCGPVILRPCRPQDLLYRRLRALADYENANKALDKARTRNREVRTAESHQQLCCQRFERLSDSAKQGKPHSPGAPACRLPTLPGSLFLSSPELMDFKSRRISSFRKNLIELAELELKHAKVSPAALLSPLAVFLASHTWVSRFLSSVLEHRAVGGGC